MSTRVDIEHRSFESSLARAAELGGADLIFTSPPYPTARPGQYGADASQDFEWPDYQRLGDTMFAALRPGGFCGIVINGLVRFWRSKEIGSERSLIAFKLAIDWAERVGLRYVEHCAYIRDGVPGVFGDRWRSGWEPLHVLQRKGPSAFDVQAYTIPTHNPGKRHQQRRYRDTTERQNDASRGICVVGKTKTLTTALSHGPCNPSVYDAEHHAPFPNWLADAFVLCYSPPNGLVCDPFVGSGTTAVSAAKHGRRFVGGDLGARERDGRRWADIARERAMEIADPAQRSLFA